MATENRNAVSVGQIRARIEAWATALRAKDVDGLMSHYAPDIVVFDLPPPLRYVGADVYRRGWEEWFATFEGPVGYEIRDLSITTGDDVAFCHSVIRISGKRTDGEETDVWARATVGYRRIDGKWTVAHEHISVPFYMDGTARAAIDLEP